MTAVLDPFAACEQRSNAAVMLRLANARISINGATAIAGIFDNDYILAEAGATGLAASAPAVTVPTSAVPTVFSGVPLQVQGAGGTSLWKIAEHHPDGTGLSVLLLERAA